MFDMPASPGCDPCLKWCGGKGALLPRILPMFPARFEVYHEPFLGGGASFFRLQPRSAILSDANADLIATYRAIRDVPEDVIAELRELTYDAETYARVRHLFNLDRNAVAHLRAAWFLYLNKTCFNGLFRVNADGEFNVPMGRYLKPTICDEAAIYACSQALNGGDVCLLCSDFESCGVIDVDDFCYFDPPYASTNGTADFTGYTADGFGEADQRRLAVWFRRLAGRGVLVAASNSDTPLVRELYAGYRIHEVSRSGSMNSRASARGRVAEVLITNYGPDLMRGGAS